MKKFVQIILIGIIVIGCDGISDSIIDPSTADILVTNIIAPTQLIYTGDDTKVETNITFSNTESMVKVWFRVASQDGLVVIGNFMEMISLDDQVPDPPAPLNTYAGSVTMTDQDPTGIYSIEYFVQTNIQEEKKMASHIFLYDNEKGIVFENISAPTELIYSGENTALKTSITLSNTYYLREVWSSLSSVENSFVINDSLEMEIISGGSSFATTTFADSTKMLQNYPTGTYTIEYFIRTTSIEKEKIATHNFEYDNTISNDPPVILNPLFYYADEAPQLRDTIETVREFILSIEVTDANGLNDIDSVYTDFYSPNNPTAIRVDLYDDGDPGHGDEIAGDGIYSFQNIFSAEAEGERKFEFWARDKNGSLSNMITHNLIVIK
ncbi:MAG: hypothetical protein KAQ90_11790 [Melioribacteraceae bacterium]|nr:hypothetical protein [Melioribacteraceae bacterium]